MTLPNEAVRQDIAKALRSGTVPAHGLEHIAVGLEPQMGAINELFEHAVSGRSAYKFIRGSYGAGKTFLSTLACSKALEADFVTSTVVISQTETPLYKLAQVYRKICLGLSTRSRSGGAYQSVVDRWLCILEDRALTFDGLEENDPGFDAAVAKKVEQHLQPLGEKAGRMVACLNAYHQCQMNDDYNSGRALLEWLSGEPKVAASVKRLAGVTGQLDNTDALIFLKGLLELIRAAGHKGLVLVLDEVETISSLRRPERQKSLEVLRTLVDALDKNEFPGLVLLVTGTPDFFEGPHAIPSLAPLHDRLRVEFSDTRPDNLRMAQIRLRSFDSARLLAVAKRVKAIYPASHRGRVEQKVNDSLIEDMVDTFTQGFGGRIAVVPRLFLREFLNLLDLVDQHESYDPRTEYAFEPGQVAQSGLSVQEQEHLVEGAQSIYL